MLHRAQRSYLQLPCIAALASLCCGAAGSIQVTLKSPSSVPPYRIENSCKDVQLYFIQLALVNRAASKR